jgi:hypothetical protein
MLPERSQRTATTGCRVFLERRTISGRKKVNSRRRIIRSLSTSAAASSFRPGFRLSVLTENQSEARTKHTPVSMVQYDAEKLQKKVLID